MPPYSDESLFARWAQMIALGQGGPLLPIYGDGKDPFYIWIGSLFYLFFDDPVLNLRLAAVVGGLATLWCLMLLTKELIGQRYPHAPYWIALLYITSPFAVFHDRVGFYESQINAIGLCIFLVSLRLIEKKKPIHILILGLLFFVGLALKNYCVYFFAIPFFILFEKVIHERTRPGAKPILFSMIAIVIGKSMHVLMHKISTWIYGQDLGLSLSMYFSSSMDEIFQGIVRNVSRTAEVYHSYVGLPLLVLFGIFIATAFTRKERGSILLPLYVIGAASLEIVLAYFIFARYLYFTIPIMLLASLWGLYRLTDWIKRKSQKASTSFPFHRLLFGLILAVCLVYQTTASVKIMKDPKTAPLDSMDRWQHVTGWPSGYGLSEVIAYLGKKAEIGPIDVFCKWDKGTGNPYEAMRLYLHNHQNIRFHLSFWSEEKPLLFFAAQGLTINNPISQNMVLREDLKAENLGDVYFVANHPRMDIGRFKQLNKPFDETKIFYKPEKESAYVIFKLKNKGKVKPLEKLSN